MSVFAPLAKRFERLVDPYPDNVTERVDALPTTFFPFLWRCADGVRQHLLLVTLFTAGIGAAEALLFSLMASLVDWLAGVKPAELWSRPQPVVIALLSVLGVSIGLAAAQALTKYQGVFGNFPMRLRWIFHRRMLAQSLAHPIDQAPHASLSEREMQTLQKIATGKRLTDIAQELMLSPKTVSVYRARVLEKLQLTNNAELTVYAIRNRLV